MTSESIPESQREGLEDKFQLSPAGIGVLQGIAAIAATLLPAAEGYFHAKSGISPSPSYGSVALLNTFSGLMIENQRSTERFRTTGVISEGSLKEGYRRLRWPVGTMAAYVGMYKVGYWMGNLQR